MLMSGFYIAHFKFDTSCIVLYRLSLPHSQELHALKVLYSVLLGEYSGQSPLLGVPTMQTKSIMFATYWVPIRTRGCRAAMWMKYLAEKLKFRATTRIQPARSRIQYNIH